MALLNRYDAPAFLPDFNVIPGQLDAWHHAVSAWFDEVIASDQSKSGGNPMQYYNAAAFDPGGIAVEQAIMERALKCFAATVRGQLLCWQIACGRRNATGFRHKIPTIPPELREFSTVHRKSTANGMCCAILDSNKIRRVTFTSEPRSIGRRSWFGTVRGAIPDQHLSGQQERPAPALYRELVSPACSGWKV